MAIRLETNSLSWNKINNGITIFFIDGYNNYYINKDLVIESPNTHKRMSFRYMQKVDVDYVGHPSDLVQQLRDIWGYEVRKFHWWIPVESHNNAFRIFMKDI